MNRRPSAPVESSMARGRMPTLVLLLIAAPALADSPRPEVGRPAGVAERFVAWWDGLGYPDLGSLPFARWLPGARARWTHVSAESLWDAGFLLREDPTTFTVLSTDLRIRTWTRTPPDAEVAVLVATKPADFATWAEAGAEVLETWSGVGTPPGDPLGFDRETGPPARFRALVVARACLARGRADLAGRLFAAADRWATRDDEGTPERTLATWQGWVASAGLAAAEERVADPGATWADVRAEFARWAKAHPQEGVRRRVQEDVTTLDRQIARGRPPSRPRLAANDEMEGLLKRLLDRGQAFLGWKGSRDAADREPTAAERLVVVGLPAVPRLLGALSDPSFTRTTALVNGRFSSRHVAVRVKEIAERILDEISAGAWRDDALLPREKVVVGTPGFRYRIEAWWAAVQARGEVEVLTGVVARGGDAAPAAAERLAALDPDRALGAIERGLGCAHGPYVREQLVSQAGRIRTDAALRVLRREARTGATRGGRVQAARELQARGDPEGLAVLVAEWGALREDAGVPPGPEGMADLMARQALLDALVGSGSAEAYRTLARGLGERSVGVRLAVVASFAPPGARTAFGFGGGGFPGPSANAPTGPLEPAAAEALEDLLRARLGDTGSLPDLSVTVDGRPAPAEVGAIAAWALATHRARRPGSPR